MPALSCWSTASWGSIIANSCAELGDRGLTIRFVLVVMGVIDCRWDAEAMLCSDGEPFCDCRCAWLIGFMAWLTLIDWFCGAPWPIGVI